MIGAVAAGVAAAGLAAHGTWHRNSAVFGPVLTHLPEGDDTVSMWRGFAQAEPSVSWLTLRCRARGQSEPGCRWATPVLW